MHYSISSCTLRTFLHHGPRTSTHIHPLPFRLWLRRLSSAHWRRRLVSPYPVTQRQPANKRNLGKQNKKRLSLLCTPKMPPRITSTRRFSPLFSWSPQHTPCSSSVQVHQLPCSPSSRSHPSLWRATQPSSSPCLLQGVAPRIVISPCRIPKGQSTASFQSSTGS